MRVVRRVRVVRGARRRLRRRGARAARRQRGVTGMSAMNISLRVPTVVTRVRERVATRREALPRPPAYLVLLATVIVLNVVELVMILSASAVQALSAYGS